MEFIKECILLAVKSGLGFFFICLIFTFCGLLLGLFIELVDFIITFGIRKEK